MAGERREVETRRVLGRCLECGLIRLGTTRIARGWTAPGARREHHLCDECIAAIDERPLGVVLAGYIQDGEPC